MKEFVIKSIVSWARWSKHEHPGLVEQYFKGVNPTVIQSKVLNTVSKIDSMKSVKSRRCSYITGLNPVVLKPGVVKFLYLGVLHPGVKNSLTTRDRRSRGCKILISWGPRSRDLRSEGTK